jgi:hypothetical protein
MSLVFFALTLALSLDPAAARVASASQALAALPWKEGSATLSPAAQAALQETKGSLRELITQAVNDRERAAENAAGLQKDLVQVLLRHGVRVPPATTPDGASPYGGVRDITVRSLPGVPGLLAVTTTVAIECGEDTSFYLYAPGRSKDPIFTSETPPYEQIDGARRRFRSLVWRQDSRGGLFIVTAAVNPWCTSNWQALRFAVYSLPAKGSPRLLRQFKKIIYLGVDEPVYTLERTQNGFALGFNTTSDPDEVYRPIRLEYRVGEGGVFPWHRQ